MAEIYYTAPSNEAFEDMRDSCLAQWATHDNSHGYADEKRNRINTIQNIDDNFMYMFSMFDGGGQHAVVERLKEETKAALRERMIDGGNEEFHLKLIGL